VVNAILSEFPSRDKRRYYFWAYPPLSVEREDFQKAYSRKTYHACERYGNSDKFYPRNVFSDQMILPVSRPDRFLFEIDQATIDAWKSNRKNTHVLFGKWLINVKKEEADDVWHDLSESIKSGKLPYRAKISTGKENWYLRDIGKRIRQICLYTPNYLWRKDVRKARTALKRFGFHSRLYYRPDILTIFEVQTVTWSDFDRSIFRFLRKHGISRLETRHRYYG
jgi:hypothetical protein